jgi:hypothetical protein
MAYLIIHEAQVSKHHYREIPPKFLALLVRLRGGGDRVFWVTSRPHLSQTQTYV